MQFIVAAFVALMALTSNSAFAQCDMGDPVCGPVKSEIPKTQSIACSDPSCQMKAPLEDLIACDDPSCMAVMKEELLVCDNPSCMFKVVRPALLACSDPSCLARAPRAGDNGSTIGRRHPITSASAV